MVKIKILRIYLSQRLILNFLLFVLTTTIFIKGLINSSQDKNILFEKYNEKIPVFAIVLCDGEHDKMKFFRANNVKRQLEQTVTLLKSAAVLTSSVLKFIIMVDKDSLYSDILKEIQIWPEDILRKLMLEKREVCFANNTSFRPLFRVCSSARLFLPQCITDLDSLIYIDTDIIFMKPPEDLWNEFENFDSVQSCGMAPNLFHYNPKLKIPYYGKTGLNAGVWMMNLTRLKDFPGGWNNAVADTWVNYKKYINVGDQDIGNIIFHKYPKYLHEIECQWNYRSFLCDSGQNFCNEAETKGVHLLHGNSLQFYTGERTKIKTMYNVWKKFEPRRPLNELVNSLEIELKKVQGKERYSNCSKIENIDQILSKGLKDYVDTLS